MSDKLEAISRKIDDLRIMATKEGHAPLEQGLYDLQMDIFKLFDASLTDSEIEKKAEEVFPYPENELYKEDDVDYQEMVWVVNSNREAFKLGFKSAVSAPQLPLWISVEERLPEINEWCICAIKHGGVLLQICQFDGEGFVPYGDPFKDDRITHWQPLPPPPIGELINNNSK